MPLKKQKHIKISCFKRFEMQTLCTEANWTNYLRDLYVAYKQTSYNFSFSVWSVLTREFKAGIGRDIPLLGEEKGKKIWKAHS